jgi:hypothetical protein
MIIGIDFDNTIVCYDHAFYRTAREQGLVPADTLPTKEQVRNYLRRAGQEEQWTELQGTVYGSRMDAVDTFAGAVDCIRSLIHQGTAVYIISHKTLHPYRGNRYNLHEAARNWLKTSGFLSDAGLGMEQVFFELTKEEKLSRIGATGCTHFIDDLPEILLADGFPAGTAPILFAPGAPTSDSELLTFASWQEITTYFRGSGA